MTYRISKHRRKYSSTPIVSVTTDAHGHEQEEIVCVCTATKKVGDVLAEKIVQLLNADSQPKTKSWDSPEEYLNEVITAIKESRIDDAVEMCMSYSGGDIESAKFAVNAYRLMLNSKYGK